MYLWLFTSPSTIAGQDIGLVGSENEVYVATMYMATVRRAPLPTGFANWVASMDAGNPGLLLVNGLLASTEYHNRFLP